MGNGRLYRTFAGYGASVALGTACLTLVSLGMRSVMDDRAARLMTDTQRRTLNVLVVVTIAFGIALGAWLWSVVG